MKVLEILSEAREAPLYHFTTEANFFKIIVSDTLMAPGAGRYAHGGQNPTGVIYFTRDYSRQFIPAQILKGSWGFRVNQGLLHQRYGKHLKAGGQSNWTEKKRQAWLADPDNANHIASANQERNGISRINGADTKDLVKGTTGLAARWESEEHLDIGQLLNFHEYITGIVYAGGKHIGGFDYGHNFKKRNPNQNKALDELCNYLMGHFRGDAGFKQRDALMDYMTKFSIPFVYQQQDFAADHVKQRMIQLWRERKAEKERRAKEDLTSWIAIRNPQGGGLVASGPSNPWTAAQQILKDHPHKFPDGMYGLKGMHDNDPGWFLQVYTNPDYLPTISMGAKPTNPPVPQNVSTSA